MPLVRSALRHRVDEQAAEAALSHVERRQQHLVLLHGVERDGLGAGRGARLAGGAETEQVAGLCAVDLDRVLAQVHAAAGEIAGRRGHLRHELHEVGEVAVDRRQAAQRRIGDRGARPRLGRVDHGIGGRRGDGHLTQCGNLADQLEVLAAGLAKADRDAVAGRRRVADAADRDAVVLVRLDTLDDVQAGGACRRPDIVAGERVPHLHLCGFDGGAGIVGDGTGQRPGGDALGRQRGGGKYKERKNGDNAD